MNRRTRETLLGLVMGTVLASAAACTAPSEQRSGGDPAADSTAIAEVRSFMETYATDLRAGNREALVARYDARGAWVVGHGRATLASPDSLRAQYAPGRWEPPVGFEWKDLAYEVLGPDAIMVVGRFSWQQLAGGPALEFSYSSVLRRVNGQWRIRLEDESGDPMALSRIMATIAPPDSAKKP